MIGSSCRRGMAAAWFWQRSGWRAASSSGRRWLMGRSLLSSTQLALLLDGLACAAQAGTAILRKKASSSRIISNLDLGDAARNLVQFAHADAAQTCQPIPHAARQSSCNKASSSSCTITNGCRRRCTRAGYRAFWCEIRAAVTWSRPRLTLGLGDLAPQPCQPPPAANDDDAVKPRPHRCASASRRRRNNGALPNTCRAVQIIEPDSTICPCCACQMHRIGECIGEALEAIPAQSRTAHGPAEIRLSRLTSLAHAAQPAGTNAGRRFRGSNLTARH